VTRLDAGLLVGGEHKIFGAQRLSLPETLVEIQHGSSFFHKQGFPRKDPGSIPPRTNRVLAEPPPNRGSADLCHQPLLENFLPDVGDGEARQRQPLAMRQFTSESFYLMQGESGLCARREVHPRGRAGEPDRISCAKIVLLAAEGLSNDVIASRLDTPRQIVSKWRG
jgi:hypothetical protein